MNPRGTISIIVPICSEEGVIPEFYNRLSAVISNFSDRYNHEIIFIDDGSQDRSLAMLKELYQSDASIRIIAFSRNFGHQSAITAGIDYAKGSAVIIIDGDLQDPPEVIPSMIAKWEQGYSVVYGIREKRKGENIFKLLTAKLFYRLIRVLSETDMPLDAGDFRLIDRKVVDTLKCIREENRYIRGLIRWAGFPQYGLSYKRDKRYAGKTKFSIRKMIKFGVDGILSFSDRPLKITAYLGFLITAGSFFMALRIAYSKFRYPNTLVSGWTSLILTVLFMGGVQLISLGIIGLYLGRQYREAKKRPLYVIAHTFGLDADSTDRTNGLKG